MCRSTTQGGRRCPSSSDPEKRKAYNAIRRARYAASKGKKKTFFGTTSNTLEDSKEASTSNASAEKVPSPPPSPAPTAANKETKETTKPKPKETTKPKPKTVKKKEPNVTQPSVDKEPLSHFGLTRKAVNTELSKLGYIKEHVLSGVLRHDMIDDASHKELGFDGKDLLTKDPNEELNKKLYGISMDEIKPLTYDEKDSLTFFTSSSYEWFNNILYRKSAPSNETKAQTSENVKRVVGHLDSAMTKAPKTQKIVYRGVPAGSGLFIGKGVHQWVDENLTQGKEIVFDGYQSSTPDLRSAKSYKGYAGGLIYEIMTPEGINVTSISHYANEHEIILPRSSRYAVVGVQKTSDGGAVVQLVAINSKGEVLDGTNADTPEDISYIDSIEDKS